MFLRLCVMGSKTKHLAPGLRASNVQIPFFFLYLKKYMGFRLKMLLIFTFFFPFPPIFSPEMKHKVMWFPCGMTCFFLAKVRLQTMSVMHPGYRADKNRTAADDIIYVLVNVLGCLTALTLYRGIHSVSNFLLQTPISFSVTLRQMSRSSLTCCDSFMFQYVCNKEIGHGSGFRSIFGKKLGETEDIYWMSLKNFLSEVRHASTPSMQIIHPLPFIKSSRSLLANAPPEEDVRNRNW